MAAGDLVQRGAAVSVAFGGLTNTNLIMQTASEQALGEIKPIKGEQGARVTELYTDPGKQYVLTGVVKNTGDALTALRAYKKGDIVTVNSVTCRIEDISLEFSAEETRCTLTVVKHDAMSYGS